MLQEKEFQAGFFAGLAKNFAFAEDFGDGAGDGEDLFPADEGVESNGEVGFGGEAAGDAEGEAEFGSGEW